MKTPAIVAAAVILAWSSRSNAFASGFSPVQDTQAAHAQSAATTEPAKTDAGAVAEANTQPKTSFMLVELTKPLKANKLQPGDTIKAQVAQDVIAKGKIIIPVETQLVGHITEVSVHDGKHTQSRLGLVFDKILLKHYRDINFLGVVQAVALPALRQSRVDQPSQMLPPSMIMGDTRHRTSTMPGRANSPAASRGQMSPSSSAATINSGSITLYQDQVPLTVKQSPSTNAAVGSTGASLAPPVGGKPMSIGTPQGVTGLKGLSLAPEASASTPGPVIVSETGNVKLDYGTQILLRVMSVEAPR